MAVPTACSDSWDEKYTETSFVGVPDPALYVSTEMMQFADAASSQELLVSANGLWTAKSNASWLSLSSTTGNGNTALTVSVDANTSVGSERTTTITVNNGIDTRTVHVTQAFMTESLQVGFPELWYSYTGGENSVSVQSNVSWSVSSNVAWLALRKNAEGTAFFATVQPNISTSERSAVITVKGVALSQTVNVTQQAVVAPTVGKASVSGITKHTATAVFNYGSAHLEVKEYGVCYSSTSTAPTTADAVLRQQGGGMTGNPIFELSELKSKTTFYVRAFVVTDLGIQYGETASFTTLASVPNEGDNGTPNY